MNKFAAAAALYIKISQNHNAASSKIGNTSSAGKTKLRAQLSPSGLVGGSVQYAQYEFEIV